MSLLSKRANQSGAVAAPVDKEQKAALRAARAENNREMRKVISVMQPPEPIRAVYAGAVVVLIAIYSYLGKDVGPIEKKGKYVTGPIPPHPADALLVAVLALIAISTVLLRKRVVTFVAFLLTGAIAVNLPLPTGVTDLHWVAFIVAAGYALWIFMFRQRKDQTAWLAEHPIDPSLSGRPAGGRPGGGARSARASKAAARPASSRRGKEEPPLLGPNGKPLPPNSGRYTRPQVTSRRAAQPKAAVASAKGDAKQAAKPGAPERP